MVGAAGENVGVCTSGDVIENDEERIVEIVWRFASEAAPGSSRRVVVAGPSCKRPSPLLLVQPSTAFATLAPPAYRLSYRPCRRARLFYNVNIVSLPQRPAAADVSDRAARAPPGLGLRPSRSPPPSLLSMPIASALIHPAYRCSLSARIRRRRRLSPTVAPPAVAFDAYSLALSDHRIQPRPPSIQPCSCL
jgi:hypothetical protein